MFVLYRRPHRWAYSAEFWHGGPHLPLGGYRIHFVAVPPTLGVGGPKNGVSASVQPKPCILHFAGGLEFAAGLENAPGETEYPC